MKTLLLFIASFALCSCTALRVDLPVSRFELPESNGTGERRLQVNLQGEPSHNYQMVGDASRRPPNLNSPLIEQQTAFGAHGSYGVAERFDLSVKRSVGRSPSMLFGKYQLLGQASPDASPGDWSLATTAGVGFANTSTKGDQNGSLGPGGYNWEATMNTYVTDAAVILGYRSSDTTLFYASGFYSNFTFDGKINHSASDNGTSPAAEYKLSTGGFQRGANLGVAIEVGRAGIFKFEGIYSDLRAAGQHNWMLSYAGSFGARF